MRIIGRRWTSPVFITTGRCIWSCGCTRTLGSIMNSNRSLPTSWTCSKRWKSPTWTRSGYKWFTTPRRTTRTECQTCSTCSTIQKKAGFRHGILDIVNFHMLENEILKKAKNAENCWKITFLDWKTSCLSVFSLFQNFILQLTQP